MTKQLCFFVCLIISSNIIIAQQEPPSLQWQRAYGGFLYEYSRMVLQTKDGGYILGGTTSSHESGDVSEPVYGDNEVPDCWIVKTVNDGGLLWEKHYGGTGWESLNYIQPTTDGGYIFAATTASNDFDVTNNHGNEDGWIVKLKATGDIEWQKTIGGTHSDEANCIRQTTDGGYIVAGDTRSKLGDTTGKYDLDNYWIVKLNAAGNVQWQKIYGGTNNDDAYNILQTTDGGYIVSGISFSKDGDITNKYGEGDYWILKLNSNGKMQWQKTYGGSKKDLPSDIIQTTDGGYAIAGYSYSNNGTVHHNYGGADALILKIDANGKFQWQKNFGGTGDDEAKGIVQNSDGTYTVAAFTNSTDGDVSFNHGYYDCWILKLTKSGTIIWQKSFGGNVTDVSTSIVRTSDGGYAVSANSNSHNGDVVPGGYGGSDYWLFKLGAENMSNISGTNFNEAANIPSINNIDVSPNPAQDFFIINYKNNTQQKINASVYNANGKVVWSSGLINANTLNGKQVNTSEFAKGIFYLKLMNENGEIISSTKIVIAK